MRFWLLLIFSLLTQESATFTASLYLAAQNHTNLWLIHALFILVTIFDIWAGYKMGAYIDRRFLHGSKFQKWVRDHSKFLQKPSRNYILVFTGIIDFPFLNGVLGSWVDLPFNVVLVTTFIGATISYALYWCLALGVLTLHINKYLEVAIIIPIVLGIIHLLRKFLEKQTEGKPSDSDKKPKGPQLQ